MTRWLLLSIAAILLAALGCRETESRCRPGTVRVVVACGAQSGAFSSARVHVQDAVAPQGKDVTLPLACPGQASLELGVKDYQPGRVLSVSVTPMTSSSPTVAGASTTITLVPGCTSSLIMLASMDAALPGDGLDAELDLADASRDGDAAEGSPAEAGTDADGGADVLDGAGGMGGAGGAGGVPAVPPEMTDGSSPIDAPPVGDGSGSDRAADAAAPDVPPDATPFMDAKVLPDAPAETGGGGAGGGSGGGAGGDAGSSGSGGGGAAGTFGSGGSGGGGSGGNSGGAGGGSGGNGGNGAPPSSRCNLSKPFGTPVATPVSLTGGAAARLSPDELTISFGFDSGNNQLDIAEARRSSTLLPFTNAKLVPGLNSPWLDASATFTADGLTALLETTRGGDYQIYLASRSAITASFATPTRLNLGPSSGDGGPFVTLSGNAVYYDSKQGGQLDLYRADLQGGASTFGVPLSSLNTPMTESGPVVTADELTLFFFSDDRDASAHGNGDIWFATRSSTSQDFGPARNLDELNTPFTETPTWISPDGCRIYFDSNQASSSGVVMYYADRPPN